MPLKHACFVSYVHDDDDANGLLMSRFMTQFVQCLNSSLGPYVKSPHKVFRDTERLRPGYRIDETIARALCESACWMVVYVPRYEDSAYARREFLAMMDLYDKRRDALGHLLDTRRGLIIPIILRGEPDRLPDVLRNHEFVTLQFTKFSTCSAPMHNNKKFMKSIDDIAKSVGEVWRALRDTEVPGVDCSQFRIPEDEDRGYWPGGPHQPFPGHP